LTRTLSSAGPEAKPGEFEVVLKKLRVVEMLCAEKQKEPPRISVVTLAFAAGRASSVHLTRTG